MRRKTQEEILAQLERGNVAAAIDAASATPDLRTNGKRADDNPFAGVRRAFASDLRPTIYPFEIAYEELPEPVAGWVAVRKMTGGDEANVESLLTQMSDETGVRPELYSAKRLQDQLLLACVAGFEIPRLKAAREPGEWAPEVVTSEGLDDAGRMAAFELLDGEFRTILVRTCAEACGRDPLLYGVSRRPLNSPSSGSEPTSGATSPEASPAGETG